MTAFSHYISERRLKYWVHVHNHFPQSLLDARSRTRQKNTPSIQNPNCSWSKWRFLVNLVSKWKCHPKFCQSVEYLIGQTFQSHIHRCNKIIHTAQVPVHFYRVGPCNTWWDVTDPHGEGAWVSLVTLKCPTFNRSSEIEFVFVFC